MHRPAKKNEACGEEGKQDQKRGMVEVGEEEKCQGGR